MRRLALIVLACLAAPRIGAQAAIRVAGTTCEDSVDPMGIDSAAPRLSWTLESAGRGEGQTAYRILAASSRALLARDRGDLWDSGRVQSDGSVSVTYGGSPLKSSQRVFWKIMAWDREGRPSAWCADAQWTMGVLSPSDWRASWITSGGTSESLLLRKAFTVRAGLLRAVAHVCGLGQFELSIDGARVGDEFLSPGWSRYGRTALYDTFDVTALLHEGDNAAALMLGNGIYDVVRRDRYAKFAGYCGPLKAIAEVRLEYADGRVELVGTDTSWRTLPGPITAGSIYSGEDFDARLEPAGWELAGFDDGAWRHAVPALGATDVLLGHGASADPIRVIESAPPVAARDFPDGSRVYDLGQNASHIPLVRVAGPRGGTIRLTPAEVVNADGTINRSTMDGKARGDAWWQYTKATDGEEAWRPRFYYAGCRYLKAEFFPPGMEPPSRPADADSGGPALDTAGHAPSGAPRIVSLLGAVVHSSARPVGSFSCSNPLLNQIRDLVRWAQRSNMVSVLTDCPHREKLGWLEQYHLNGPSIRYEFDVRRIFSKGMHDIEDSQDPDGLVPNIAPEYVRFDGAFRSAAEWGAASIIVPWQQYEFTGDSRLIRSHYPSMQRYFAFLESQAKDGVLSMGLGDWFDLGPNPPGPSQFTPPEVTASAFYYDDAMLLGSEAAVLGNAEDAGRYAAKARLIRDAYNRHFFHGDTATYGAGSQCAEAIALVMGIVPEAQRERVFRSLVADIERHGGMTTGDIGYRYLLLALAQGGRSDIIYRMINQVRTPGYGFQIAHGETSLTEAWDANLHTSHDHFMLGQIEEWFYRYLVGIDYKGASPGFKSFVVRPQPVGDLTWATASYDGAAGRISVRWDHVDGNFTLQVHVPPGSSALVFVPTSGMRPVTESGVPAERSPGVVPKGREGDRESFKVGSGDYRFASSW